MVEVNGNGDGRVAFTKDGTKTLLPEHAAAMLTVMYEHNRSLFGYYLSYGVTGEPPLGPRRRRS